MEPVEDEEANAVDRSSPTLRPATEALGGPEAEALDVEGDEQRSDGRSSTEGVDGEDEGAEHWKSLQPEEGLRH